MGVGENEAQRTAGAYDEGGQIICRPVSVHYFLRVPNVGDRVVPDVVTAATGVPTTWTRSSDAPHVLAVGSILALARPESRIWGTGCMGPEFGVGDPRPENIWALRGKLTAEALAAGGVRVPDVPLGDPGWLAPQAYGVRRTDRPRFRLGVVAHYADRSDGRIGALLAQEGVADLDVRAAPEAFLRAMADCAAVASGSLHGLIFAEALGVPNLWLTVGNNVLGGDFKFLDWYSTTRRPETGPFRLNGGEDADALAGRARLHESLIDAEALAAAASPERLEPLRPAEARRLLPAPVCRRRPMPVFVISHDRGTMLEQCLAGLRAQDMPLDIVVRDNGSRDPSTLTTLKALEASGVAVERAPPINRAEDLNQIEETIAAHMVDWGEPQPYAVTDCDIDLSEAAPWALRLYRELLNDDRKADVAGPMLRIQDIPKGYPLRRHAINRHVDQFWSILPEIRETSFGPVALQRAWIDTTLAVHRAGVPFWRIKEGLRVYAPADARHLDWHVTGPAALRTTTAISHWSNRTYAEARVGERFRFSGYWDVEAGADGRPVPVRRKLPLTPTERAWLLLAVARRVGGLVRRGVRRLLGS